MRLKCNYPKCTYEVTDNKNNKNAYLDFESDVFYAMAMHWDDAHMDFEEIEEDEVEEEDIEEEVTTK